MSSAKDSKFNLFEFPMSFIYIRNKIGPKMDPWGMPHLIYNRSDWVSYISKYCFLFFK